MISNLEAKHSYILVANKKIYIWRGDKKDSERHIFWLEFSGQVPANPFVVNDHEKIDFE
jgi:hypothetical protein